MNPIARIIAALVVALTFSGCATTSNNPKDPMEGFNRAMYSFNDVVDKATLKPLATVYSTILPNFVQTGIGNFFGNIGDVWTSVNNMLQGKVIAGISDVGRVLVNSTVGLAGLFDVASHAGMTKHKEDFGQTLGVWGVSSGPYMVLPLLGPSTLRDTVALPFDFKGDPWGYVVPVNVRNSGTLLRLIDVRAGYLDAADIMEAAALDPYEFLRDAYLQRRQNQVSDGESSQEKSQEKSDNKADDKAPKSKADPKTSLNEGRPIEGNVEQQAAQPIERRVGNEVKAHEGAGNSVDLVMPLSEPKEKGVSSGNEHLQLLIDFV